MVNKQKAANVSVYAVMTNKLKSSQLKDYIKLPVLQFTFLILKDSFLEFGLQAKVKRLLLKNLKKL